jgi:hypothetical protein
LFAGILTRERVSAHYGPIDVLGHMLEEGRSVTILQPSENLAYLIGCSSEFRLEAVNLEVA